MSFLPLHARLTLCLSVLTSSLSRLHEVLMDLQQQQLQQLSDWLTHTEERIRKIETEPAAKDLELYTEQIEQHKVNTLSISKCLSCMNLVNEEQVIALVLKQTSLVISLSHVLILSHSPSPWCHHKVEWLPSCQLC